MTQYEMGVYCPECGSCEYTLTLKQLTLTIDQFARPEAAECDNCHEEIEIHEWRIPVGEIIAALKEDA